MQDIKTPIQKAIKTLNEKYPDHSLNDTFISGENVELEVKENNRRPGHPIFVKGNGKVGFPAFGSIDISIGDTIRGEVVYEHEYYFLVRVNDIIKKSLNCTKEPK
jgi:hypothetical protein